MIPPPLESTLFPYTTLFRSRGRRAQRERRRARRGRVDQDRAGGDRGGVADVVGAGQRVQVALAVGGDGERTRLSGSAAVAPAGAVGGAEERLRARAGDHVRG